MLPLVDAAWLGETLAAKSAGKQADLRVVDVRWYLRIGNAPWLGKSGKSAYAEGHIPQAVFVDLDAALARSPATGPGRHPLPRADAFERAMQDAGVNDTTFVVAYDDAGGSIAARLWWLLRHFGHENVAVLDGGIDAWKRFWNKKGGALTTETPSIEKGNFKTKDPLGDVVDRDAVARARARGALVLDARARERYRGDTEPVDARAGHIPGAINAPWSENLEDGKFLSADKLTEKYREIGATPDREVIAYCGSGVTACHDLLALELAGIHGAKLYEGSWSDWSAQENFAVATGDEPSKN